MRSLRLSIAASLVALLGACSNQGDTSRISVLLTDSSASFKAAVVTITEVDLVAADGTSRVLSTNKVTTNLLTLANDTKSLVENVTIPTGAYTQLRFVISGGYVDVGEPGTPSAIYASSPTYEGLPAGATIVGNLQMPSYAQSGLKIDLPGGHVDVGTEAHVLLVDFDVHQSFGQQAGASGMWVMHPVVTATELEFSGTVNVKLALDAGVSLPEGVTLDEFSAVLVNSGGSPKALALAIPPGTGYAAGSFTFLIPGDYTVSITGPAGVTFTTSPASPAPVAVASGQPTEADFTITAITAASAQ